MTDIYLKGHAMKISKRWAFALLGVGAVTVACGIALVYPPAALIVGGAALCAFAFELVEVV